MQFNQEQLDKALLDVDDLMHRCFTQSVYVVLGNAAKCLHDQISLDGDGIEVGLERRYVDKVLLGTFHTYTNGRERPDGFDYDVEGVPVHIQFIENEYEYFRFPDQRFYGPEDFQIPNQFEKYWSERGVIS